MFPKLRNERQLCAQRIFLLLRLSSTLNNTLNDRPSFSKDRELNSDRYFCCTIRRVNQMEMD